ncbi:unnamed protein product [Closterium sp. NIES-64]|nr:unnamed protein product [Closterium sp. NIES-64]
MRFPFQFPPLLPPESSHYTFLPSPPCPPSSCAVRPCLSIVPVFLSSLSFYRPCLSIVPVFLSSLSFYRPCLSIVPVFLSSLSFYRPCLSIIFQPFLPTSPVPVAAYECSPGCRLQRLANGVCDAPCNTPACAFDGGDCACVDPLFGPGICACPPGHTRRDDGSCCLSTAVGANLNFPFSLQRYGPNYTESNFAFAAERGFAANRYVSHRNRLLIGMVLHQERWGTQQCSGPG